MSCQAQTKKPYTERPSPPYKAPDCPNEVRRGNDGNMWQSKQTTKGIYRWVKVKTNIPSTSDIKPESTLTVNTAKSSGYIRDVTQTINRIQNIRTSLKNVVKEAYLLLDANSMTDKDAEILETIMNHAEDGLEPLFNTILERFQVRLEKVRGKQRAS